MAKDKGKLNEVTLLELISVSSSIAPSGAACASKQGSRACSTALKSPISAPIATPAGTVSHIGAAYLENSVAVATDARPSARRCA